MWLTPTAALPPYSSKYAVTSRSAPSGRWYQVLTRGLPCAPPLFAPTAASTPSRQPTEYMIARSP
jgi:hypothetical protein